jgi:1-acyl-sn-glycerol-3-phosphate acyltransferase
VIIVRSLIYNICFYINLALYIAIALPALFLPHRVMLGIARSWGRTAGWLLRIICGLNVEIRGIENIPSGALLVASKHQSAWETFALLPLFSYPTIVLKRELTWLPFFGWYLRKAGMIALDRGAGKDALASLIARTRAALAVGRQVIVFPEGTRRQPGAEPDYKLGIVQMYSNCGVACLPVALNSGIFWPRRKFLRYPGTIVVEILPPIPPGLPRAAFFRRLQGDIETATQRLIEEAQRESGHSPSGRAAPAPQFKDL